MSKTEMDMEVDKDHIVSQGLAICNGRSLLDDPTAVHLKKTGAARHDLDDLIWTEILCRLPSPKSAFKCKSVSKYWNSLISHKYFISRFIDHHRRKKNSYLHADQLFFFFVDLIPTSANGLLATSGDRGRTSYRVESSFNDLLVCSDLKKDPFVCDIFNPFTKENIKLPVCGPCGFSPDVVQHVGFVCEPFYTQGLGQFGFNASYMYRVVRIVSDFYSNKYYSFETYCSETRQWSARTSLRNDYGCISNVVAHNGKLWWYNFFRDKVIVHDPFVTMMRGEPCFNFHSLNITPSPTTTRFHLAKSLGSLLSMAIMKGIATECEVSIWKLKEKGQEDDHHHESWCFERRVTLNHIILDTAPSFLHQVDPFFLMLSIHPNNPDVILLSEFKSLQVASYNMVTKEWQLVGEIQQFRRLACELSNSHVWGPSYSPVVTYTGSLSYHI